MLVFLFVLEEALFELHEVGASCFLFGSLSEVWHCLFFWCRHRCGLLSLELGFRLLL